MPVQTNSIGDFTFIDLVGTIYLRQESLEVIERPGVVGTGFRKLAARGKPFELVSINYVWDFATARTALIAYNALVGEDPVAVIRNSINYGTFVVLNVTEAEPPFAVYNVIGTPDTSVQVRQTIKWQLHG
jgi:hypothetical protein